MRTLIDTTGSNVPVTGGSFGSGRGSSGIFTLIATAVNWSGTSVKVEISLDGVVWFDSGVIFSTAEGTDPKNLHVGNQVGIRAVVTECAGDADLIVGISAP